MWSCPKCRKRVDDEYEICWSCGTSVDGLEDPHFLDERTWEKGDATGPEADVVPESLVTLIKCSMVGQAHAIRVRLESEGIPVFLFDEFTIAMDWMLSNAIGGVKVQVPEPFLERARAILGIVEQEQLAAADKAEAEERPDEDDGDASESENDAGILNRESQEGVTEQNSEKPE